MKELLETALNWPTALVYLALIAGSVLVIFRLIRVLEGMRLKMNGKEVSFIADASDATSNQLLCLLKARLFEFQVMESSISARIDNPMYKRYQSLVDEMERYVRDYENSSKCDKE